MRILEHEQIYPILLSTLAGLSTSIGGAIAIIKKPDESTLALLLGTAIGVMATVSVSELWLRNALDNDFLKVTAAAVAGALTFYFIDPLLAKMDSGSAQMLSSDAGADDDSDGVAATATGRTNSHHPRPVIRATKRGGSPDATMASRSFSGQLDEHPMLTASASSNAGPAVASPGGGNAGVRAAAGGPSKARLQQPRSLLRLGVLMAVTMTLHNLPEGFAVAFSAFSRVGPLMALAIAVHNIPEGIIVAAPIYAATDSRWKAMAAATASGLSEPVGALLAMFVVKPLLTVHGLHYMLAFVGGIMLSVCMVELWPEARKCGHDARLWQGITLGTIVMGWTLYIGV